MKDIQKLLMRLACACLWVLLPCLLYAQGAQWTTSVNAGGSGNVPKADWIFDVITTQEGNYLGVGFAKEDETVDNEHPEVPGYCLIGPNGALLRDGVVEMFEPGAADPMRGRLDAVTEGSNDSYYATGFIGGFGPGQKGLLLRINKTSLDCTPFVIVPQGFTRARISDIVNVGGASPYLLLCGQARSDGQDQRWIAAYRYNGTLIHEHVFPAQGAFAERTTTLDYEIVGNTVNIFSASYDLVNAVEGGVRRNDSDILISQITYTPDSGAFTETSASYNSILQGEFDGFAIPNEDAVGATTIFGLYPPSNRMDKYPYGPKYLNTNFARSFPNCNEDDPANGYFIEDWSDGSEDFPYGLVTTNNDIVVSALLNRLTMWKGINDDLGKDTNPGLNCHENSCSNFDAENYLWGEAYLLIFNKSDLSLRKATHLGTMSGGDFHTKLIKTSDGGFAISGTVTGCPQDLPGISESEHMMVIKTDANGDILWRKHYNGQGEGSCAFALTESLDGGIVVAGNTEGDAPNDEENYGFIKFGSDCNYNGANVLPNSGKDYIVAADEPAWNTSRLVKARVVVPNGRTLSITGNTTVIRFADSKEVYDAPERYPIGITVEPGGKLAVSGATLTGYDCTGKEKMWDGINIVGNPAMPQTPQNQGTATFVAAKIINARQGIVASGVWCGTTTTVGQPYGGTGSQSSVQTSALYHGGPFGGGKITAWNTEFIDNQRSAIFMQYLHNWSLSKFTNCEFISNGPLMDPNELRQPVPNDYNNNEPHGTSIHVSIWSTRVQFSGCKFNGALSIVPEYRPFGIEGDDPKIVASGGNMKDLKIGIECRGTLGGILANVNANGITFDNVVQGVNLRNSVADIVANCHFLNIPEPNTFSQLSPSGIFGQFNKGALIRDNEFHGSQPGKPSWGIVEHNTQNQGCEIKENKFFTARVGNQFEGKNTQLDAFCNDYTGAGLSAWYAAVTFGAGQLKPQGSPGQGLKKADNEFFDFCDGSSNIHIEADDNFTPFGYYDKTGNPHPVDPDCVNDLVNVDIAADNSSLACTVPEPPCPNPPCDRVAIYMASPKTVQDRNVALRGLVHAGFAADTTDLAADYEGAMYVLRDRNQPEDRSILVGSLASMGRYAEAQVENALLIASDAESVAYNAYLTNIIGAGTDLSALPAVNYQTAMASLSAQNVSTRTMAENLRYLREGLYSPLIAVDPEPGGERSQRHKAAAAKLTYLSVQPNPFSQEVLFDLSGLDATVQYQVVLTDLYGRQIAVRQAFGGQPLIWNAAKLPDGQYVYQVCAEKAVIQSGKLLKTSH